MNEILRKWLYETELSALAAFASSAEQPHDDGLYGENALVTDCPACKGVGEVPCPQEVSDLGVAQCAVCKGTGDAPLNAVAPNDLLMMSEPWPLHEVVRKLAEAADHLLTAHGCDTHGHEEIATARDVARRWLSSFALSHVLPKREGEQPGGFEELFRKSLASSSTVPKMEWIAWLKQARKMRPDAEVPLLNYRDFVALLEAAVSAPSATRQDFKRVGTVNAHRGCTSTKYEANALPDGVMSLYVSIPERSNAP